MTGTEAEILRALTELDRAVRSLKSASPKPELMPLFQQIDDLALRLPTGSSPELLHYLRKKSYEKARLWLEQRRSEIQRGDCRRD